MKDARKIQSKHKDILQRVLKKERNSRWLLTVEVTSWLDNIVTVVAYLTVTRQFGTRLRTFRAGLQTLA